MTRSTPLLAACALAALAGFARAEDAPKPDTGNGAKDGESVIHVIKVNNGQAQAFSSVIVHTNGSSITLNAAPMPVFTLESPEQLEQRLYSVLGRAVPLRLEHLSYGPARRLATKIPVGGADDLTDLGDGWKIEELYKLPETKQKALEELRASYAAESAKLQARLDGINRAFAARALELRLKYELRANDVLTGQDRDQKRQLDGFAKQIWLQQEGLASKAAQDGARAKKQIADGLTQVRVLDENKFQVPGSVYAALQNFTLLISKVSQGMRKLGEDAAAKAPHLLNGPARERLERLFRELKPASNAAPLSRKNTAPSGAKDADF
ncbi:MAG: hypothetical protein M5U26_08015 [Planctomycetota bacterium]|nr:hypothetical protein [Planctomycetota bacterium]